jgi:methylthioribulose 1-phosphate dehydratase/enolase-phosphatase E1
MIKGIEGHGYFDELVIPIIENTAWEHELADSLGETIAKYPKACAVLVRRHGMYVWGSTWEQAKRHGECLHYLFDIAISMKKLGIDFNSPPKPVSLLKEQIKKNTSNNNEVQNQVQKKKKSNISSYSHVIFDIEGTIAPITFVKETLFPYASTHAQEFLQRNWEHSDVQNIVKDLFAAIIEDNQFSYLSNDLSAVEKVTTYIKKLIAEDRKLPALKKLQGLIWDEAYKKGDIVAPVYADFPIFLQRLKEKNIGVSIYSSGSRLAQQLLLKYSNEGDLSPFFSSFFDTNVGFKTEAASYNEIALTLGYTEKKQELLFITDLLQEAIAAREAGFQVVIAKRVGNAEILNNDQYGFDFVENFDFI